MTLAALRLALDRRTGIAQDVTAQNVLINEALQQIASHRPWPWLDGVDTFTTTAGTASYALPADYESTRSVSIDGTPARAVAISDGDTYANIGERPSAYSFAVEGLNLVIYPTPAQVEVIHRYQATEPLLSGDTDSPLLPAQYHALVADYGAWRICDQHGDKRASAFRSAYESGLKGVRGGRYGEPRRIRVRAGGML